MKSTLDQKDAFLLSVFEDSPSGIALVNPSGNINMVNNAFCSLIGYSRDEVLKHKFFDFLHEDNVNSFESILSRVKKAEHHQLKAYKTFQRKDGDKFIAQTDIKGHFDKDSNLEFFVITCIDASEKQKTEQALERSEKRFRMLFEMSPFGIAVKDIQTGKIAYANLKFGEILGFPASELIGKPLNDITFFEDFEEKQKLTRQLIDGEINSFSTFKQYISSEETPVWCRTTRFIIEIDGNNYLIGFIEDISKQREAEEEIQKSNYLNKNIAEIIPDFIGVVDLEADKLLYGNQGNNYFGWSIGEGEGFSSFFNKIVLPGKAHVDFEELTEKVRQASDSDIVDFIFLIKNGNGHERWIHQRARVFSRNVSGETKSALFMHMDITDKKKMDDAVAKIYQSVPEASYQEFYNHLVKGIANILDVPYVYFGVPDFEKDVVRCKSVYQNGKILDRFEYPLCGSRCEKVLKEKKMLLFQKNLDKLFPDDEDIKKLKSVAYLGIPIFDAENEVIGIISILDNKAFADNSFAENILQIFASRLSGELQRHEALSLIEERESKFRGMFENNPIPVAVRDADAKIDKVNAAFCKMLGYTENELSDKFFADITHPEDKLIGDQIFERQIAQGATSLYEYQKRYIHKKGHTIWVAISATVVWDQDDNFKYSIGVIRDITTSKKAEEERQRIYYEQQKMLDGIPAFFIYKDANNNVIRCNKRAADTLGITVEEMEGKNVRELYPEEAERYHQEDLEVIASGKPKLGIVELIQFADGTRWIRTDKMPYYDQDGKVTGVLVYAIDITNLKNTQQELESKNEKLEKYIDSNLLLENFAYIASHDLKEPVRTVCNFAQLLEKEYKDELESRGQEYIDFIVGGAKDMNQLIGDLLMYSRVKSQKKKTTDVDLTKLMFLMQRNLANSIREYRVTIDIGQLPGFIRGNKTKLSQVFQNLVSNAIKFRKPEVDPVIRISARDAGPKWEFSVADNGIGIESQFFERIFLLFKRLHTKSEFEGTGIGLALCKKIVEQHGGEIWVNSTLGQGTTILFTIPKVQRTEV
ncbi:MAG: PAS domain S-box protein [Bacteroidota bacterium]